MRRLVIFVICTLVFNTSFSQSYNDGPISVDVKLREVQGNFEATDEALLGVGFAPDELTFYIWTQDNLFTYPWTGGACMQDNNFTPTIGGANSIDFNTTFANFSFPSATVPQYLDFKIDAWEDDLPSDAVNLGPASAVGRHVAEYPLDTAVTVGVDTVVAVHRVGVTVQNLQAGSDRLGRAARGWLGCAVAAVV